VIIVSFFLFYERLIILYSTNKKFMGREKINIIVISFFWWLIQGILLLINEIRCLLEYKKFIVPSIFVVSICLIVISFLLLVRNNLLISILGTILFLYSIVSLIFLTFIFFLEAGRNYWAGLFLLIPILNIILSAILLKRMLKQ